MQVIDPREKDLGGFSVRRLLPYHSLKMVGPFIFFDHLGPAHFEAGDGIDVRPHPHIGLATVTYLFDGELIHRDSLGNDLAITAGAINLMVSGRGIVHSERTAQTKRAQNHTIHALQLWLALPEEQQECEPSFTHIAADKIPRVSIPNGTLRVMMGCAFGVTSPVPQLSPTLYIEAKLDAGATLTLPIAQELAVYMVGGNAHCAGENLTEHHLITVTSESILTTNEPCHMVIIGGDTLGKRHIWWNFVSTNKKRIEQAKADWKSGNFPKVPGEDEFIPLPDDT